LALPRLWPRERADDVDLPLHAVAENGGNVLSDFSYEGLRRVCFEVEDGSVAMFVPVHDGCGLFVKADDVSRFGENGWDEKPNATCKKHGRVAMLFEGFY